MLWSRRWSTIQRNLTSGHPALLFNCGMSFTTQEAHRWQLWWGWCTDAIIASHWSGTTQWHRKGMRGKCPIKHYSMLPLVIYTNTREISQKKKPRKADFSEYAISVKWYKLKFRNSTAFKILEHREREEIALTYKYRNKQEKLFCILCYDVLCYSKIQAWLRILVYKVYLQNVGFLNCIGTMKHKENKKKLKCRTNTEVRISSWTMFPTPGFSLSGLCQMYTLAYFQIYISVNPV